MILVAAACSDAGQPTSQPTSMPTPAVSTFDTEPPPDTTAVDTVGGVPSLAEQAVLDLAGRLGIAPEAIDVVVAEAVTWRNGSLGCPEPGMAYTQALVNGFRVVLGVDGVDYAYHSGRGRPPFYCATPAANEPLPNT
jgi:hypothetical protein